MARVVLKDSDVVQVLIRAISDDRLERSHLRILALAGSVGGGFELDRSAVSSAVGVAPKSLSNAIAELKTAGYVNAVASGMEAVAWEKSGGKCHYCAVLLNPFDRRADNGFQVDHHLARALGGTDDHDNIVASCSRCNTRKGKLTPQEWSQRNG